MSAQDAATAKYWDVERVRKDFPGLDQEIYGKRLVYLDNAATTQRARPVMDALERAYGRDCANVHRGVHALSQRATALYEEARGASRRFLNARRDEEIIFVRGTTEAINLVANTIGRQRLGPGDEVLITGLEHHSNIVPWQMLCAQTGATLVVAQVDDSGDVPLAEFEARLSGRTKVTAFAHVSNALGTVLPVREMITAAHRHGAITVVDGAQAIMHMPVDVQALGADFYAVSGHKVFGPTGIGVLYGRHELLLDMPPWQGGGDMIRTVSFEGSTWAPPPARFEAGTPHIAGAIGLGAAFEYVMGFDFAALQAYEADLLSYGMRKLSEISGLRMIGTAPGKSGVLSFVIEGVHPHDIGTILDREGVAVRAGHHCAQPVMKRFGVPATTRASLTVYNTRAEIDALVKALELVTEMFG